MNYHERQAIKTHILQLTLDGVENKKIAKKLGISDKQVSAYLYQVYLDNGVKSMHDLKMKFKPKKLSIG